ncbi:outer membrane protein assembly factor BamB family protein [Adhaeretor mobilis]|uniref:Outer membrane biogenesis protein BamB n=1 Tax=Adhaeretor mobilis TaxID=1930276 RepID=A0A517MT17_9BACT|nr:PQQ-binding-like beta-propeller repeat protein [Adhaeretor mobilis]QDS97992.1 outer membrane biogenesis protein BamB [Adhaeretor mobilis]
MPSILKLLACLLIASNASAQEASWPQFRGPGGQGHATEEHAPLTWSETENIRFKTAIPGKGWSSPVVLGNQIWLTTAIETPPDPAELEQARAAIPNAETHQLAGELSLRAVCVDRTTGKLIHNIELIKVEQPNAIHPLNSYASPTPVIEPGRLYCNFGRYGTVCVNTDDHSIVWKKQFPIEHFVGPGSSPVLCDDKLVLTCDGADKQFIVAINKADGEKVWKVDRPAIRVKDPDMRKSYCTPLVVQHLGKKQIIIPGAQWIVAYAPADGSEIWRVDHGQGFSIVPRPVTDGMHVFCATGFAGVGMLAVRLGGSGDITGTHLEWKNHKKAPNQPSPILREGRLYTVNDQGVAQCLESATGEELWSKRLPGAYSASPLLIDERLYFFNREGLTTVLSTTGKKPEELASNQLDGQQMATPAVVDGELILRTDTHLYGIGK